MRWNANAHNVPKSPLEGLICLVAMTTKEKVPDSEVVTEQGPCFRSYLSGLFLEVSDLVSNDRQFVASVGFDEIISLEEELTL